MALPPVASIWGYLWDEREKKRQSVFTTKDKRDWITTWQNWAVLLKYCKSTKANRSTWCRKKIADISKSAAHFVFEDFVKVFTNYSICVKEKSNNAWSKSRESHYFSKKRKYICTYMHMSYKSMLEFWFSRESIN